jgi:hypothetical protein
VTVLVFGFSRWGFAQELRRGATVFEAGFEGPDALKGWTAVGEGKSQVVARREGSSALMVERPADGKPGAIILRLPLPVEKLRGARVNMEAMVKAENVAKPPQEWNGVKFMLHTTGPGGQKWSHQNNLYGTFDWQPIRFVAAVPKDANEAWLCLGLQDTTGKAWFDDVRVSIASAPRQRPTTMPASTAPAFRGHDLPRLRGVMISQAPKKEDLLELGRKWNANLVRWQLHRPEVNYGSADGRDMKAFDAWLEASLKRLDELLPVCEEAGLLVLIDLHTPPGGHDRKTSQHLVFREEAFQKRFLEVWDHIARRYKNANAVWGYDLFNEPIQGVPAEGLMDWQELATAAAKRIRAIDPNRAIIVEPDPGGPPEGLDFLQPIDVPGVVYSVHMYVPHQFTHQGVFGLPTGLKYPGEVAGRRWDKDALRAALRPVVEFQRDYGAHVFIGEFSAIRWAPDNSAYRYLKDLIDIFEENGWDWTYHAFREWDGWSVEHGDDPKDRSPSKTRTDREKLLRSWFEKNKKP